MRRKTQVFLGMFAIIFVVIIALAVSLFFSYFNVYKANVSDTEPYPFYNGGTEGNHLIAHAGGEIDGYQYTNSYEAVEASIKAKVKYIEIDLIKSSDNVYIGGHEEDFNKMINNPLSNPLSLQEIHSRKLYGKYSVIDETQIVELMRKYPDWILVTDKADDFEHLAKAFPCPNRMIVEVFSILNYFKALKAGIRYPALQISAGRRKVSLAYKKLLKELNIKAITLGEKSFLNNLEYMKELHNQGVTILLYGNPYNNIVNDSELINKYVNQYLSLVYTDKAQELTL